MGVLPNQVRPHRSFGYLPLINIRLQCTPKRDSLKLLIIQPNIRRYRADFFEALAQHAEQVSVVHFGLDQSNSDCCYARVRLDNSFWGRIVSVPKLIKEHLDHDVSIIVFDTHFWNVLIAALVGSLFKPVLFWGHGMGRSRLGRLLRWSCFSWGKGINVYGDIGREQVMRSGISSDRIFVARNTQVVPGFFDSSGYDKEYFLFVGRLQDRKRLDILLRAYAKYVDAAGTGALRLMLVGDGPILAELKSLARDLGIQKQAKFVAGTTDPDQLAKTFERAVAYVSPGHVGLGVLHSFAFGVPVITFDKATHAPEYENLIDKINGLILPESEAALADTLFQIAAEPQLASRLGREAFKTYRESAHPSYMVDKFLEAAKFAVSRPGGQGC
mgnify:CR=1 FL=1